MNKKIYLFKIVYDSDCSSVYSTDTEGYITEDNNDYYLCNSVENNDNDCQQFFIVSKNGIDTPFKKHFYQDDEIWNVIYSAIIIDENDVGFESKKQIIKDKVKKYFLNILKDKINQQRSFVDNDEETINDDFIYYYKEK